jgi:Predicted transcriptional regulators
MDYIILGLNIRSIRRKNNYTQEKLSEKVGISPVFLSQIENGNRKPSLETVVNIANSLNVTVDELLTNKSSLEQLKSITNVNFTSEQLNILSKTFEKRSAKEIKALLYAFSILLDFNKE